MWQCGSTPPGRIRAPVASMARWCGGRGESAARTASMRPACTTTVAGAEPPALTTVPPWMTRSAGVCSLTDENLFPGGDRSVEGACRAGRVEDRGVERPEVRGHGPLGPVGVPGLDRL